MPENNPRLIGLSHPGKFGDLLYSIPGTKFLCDYYGAKCHFYTSAYYGSIKRLLDYQDYVEECIIPETYQVLQWGWGAQPSSMRSHFRDIDYIAIHEFGFRHFPDRPLHEWYLHEEGINISPPLVGFLSYPDIETLDEDYIVIAPRGDYMFKESFDGVIEKSPVAVVQIGMEGEAWEGGIDKTGLDWLETVSWLSKAKAFYGIISSQGALAQNFDNPKVYCHNGGGWDMRHVPRTPTSFYEVFPSAERILELMGLR